MAIRYSDSVSHLRKRRLINMMPLLPRSYPTRWRPLSIATYSGMTNAICPTCLYWKAFLPRKKENELYPPSKLPAKLIGETSCRAIDIPA